VFIFDNSYGDDAALVKERLRLAQARVFNHTITGYMSQVLIIGGHVFGFLHGHALGDRVGRFKDGNLIYTSMITGIHREGDFWIVQTLNSHYCLLTTQKHDGEVSVRRLLERFKPIPFIRRIAH
jgi:hypothetical protein